MIGNLHAQDRLATGNPVYNASSNAATFGTVDPAGYVERGRRSGLAASILAAGRPGGDPRNTGRTGGGPTIPPHLLGQTASRVDRAEIIRRLAARLANGGS